MYTAEVRLALTKVKINLAQDELCIKPLSEAADYNMFISIKIWQFKTIFGYTVSIR